MEMSMYEGQINGKPITYSFEGIKFGNATVPFSQMTGIEIVQGPTPSWRFSANGRWIQIPYQEAEREVVEFFVGEGIRAEAMRAQAFRPAPEQPVQLSSQTYEQPPQYTQPPMYVEKYTGFWSVGRLVLGIIAIVLAMFVVFQSCAAGVVNALEESDDVSGSIGVFVALLLIAGGVTGICTRNAKKRVGPIITAVLFFLGALCGIAGGQGIYEDLLIWGIVSACLGVFYIICAIKTNPDNR